MDYIDLFYKIGLPLFCILGALITYIFRDLKSDVESYKETTNKHLEKIDLDLKSKLSKSDLEYLIKSAMQEFKIEFLKELDQDEENEN